MSLALITGASRGIGAAIAVEFARTRKVNVALVARDGTALRKVAEECRGYGVEALFFSCDLTREPDVKKMAASLNEASGKPDILVNNAGVFKPGSVRDTSPTDFSQQVDINLTSAFSVTHHFLNGMVERGSGHIVFIGSVAAIKGYPTGAAYCAAKHGLLGLARALREETKESGIRVTTVLPGATLTRTWEGENIPASRLMPPEDVARAVVASCQMTGRSVVEEILIRPQLGDL